MGLSKHHIQRPPWLHHPDAGCHLLPIQMSIWKESSGHFHLFNIRHCLLEDDLYDQYLKERWKAGCQNRLKLWREIQEQGFTGSAQLVYFWSKQRELRKEHKTTPPKKHAAKKSYLQKSAHGQPEALCGCC